MLKSIFEIGLKDMSAQLRRGNGMGEYNGGSGMDVFENNGEEKEK